MKRTVLSILFFIFCTITIQANVTLPKLVSNGMVLQRNTTVKIWGWATIDEIVEVHFIHKKYTTKANEQGYWEIVLYDLKAGGPHSMTIQGNNKITITNILIGDVWLCSGQSNMELTMSRLKDKYPEAIKNCENSNIRQFLVPDKYDFNTEHSDLESGSWNEANPTNILDFSGVAYFYAIELYNKYQVPIGLINASLGGSPVEAWMSEDALKEFPLAYEELQKFKNSDLILETEQNDTSRQQNWYLELNSEDNGFLKGSEWFLDSTKDHDWDKMELPGYWANEKLGNINGVVWFRKKVTIPKSMVGKDAKLWLGRCVDQDHVYLNGTFIGSTGYQYPPRKYHIPNTLLKEGENIITVRLINEQGKGGFVLDKPYFIAAEKDSIDLKGLWKYKLGTEMQALRSPTFIRWKPGGLYNKMIAPLTNYNIKGVIWYQGESNTNNPQLYAKTFPVMILNWRSKWQLGNFPFLFVQLANFMETTNKPVESNWAQLRQLQLETLAVPNTGMAVTIDLGEWNDIHPLNKQEVGKRLAQQAYKIAYKESSTNTSPIPVSQKFYKSKVTIEFSHKNIISKNKETLKTFEISNDGKLFFAASAKIKNNKVVVKNNMVKKPIAVRYAWSNNPIKANLYSSDYLPASPFEIRKQP